MVKSRDQLLECARNIIGDRDDDEALSFIEDLTDSYTDNEDWHAKYNQLDADWRAKYKERFFAGVDTPETPADEPEKEVKKLSYSDLFIQN